MSRRNFLGLWRLVALLVLAGAVSAQAAETGLARHEYEKMEMGLPFRIVLYAENDASANAAAAAAFQRIRQLNGILSDYDEDSELSQLSRTSGQGKQVVVSEDLWNVLKRAQDLAERSGGAFDVTVGPCVLLWRKARHEHHMPDPELLKQALQSVGYQHVKMYPDKRAIELLVPGMRLDVGGVGKGYAVDEALKVLVKLGITRALVGGGGDMAAGDPPPNKAGWRIEIVALDVPNAPPARIVSLAHTAIATSGDRFQRLEIDGQRYSHIVDPHTGIGLTDHSLVTVLGPDCMTVDSLTKVVSVLGPEKGIRFIEAEPGNVATRITREPNDKIEVFESSRFGLYRDKKSP